MSTDSWGTVGLRSFDDQVFELDEAAAMQSVLLADIVTSFSRPDEPVYCQNVNGEILAKVVDYLKHHANDSPDTPMSEELRKYDEEFVNVDHTTLFEYMLAARFLHINKLMEVAGKAVAKIIEGMTPQQVRETFNIVNDFTPEEEAELLSETTTWAFK